MTDSTYTDRTGDVLLVRTDDSGRIMLHSANVRSADNTEITTLLFESDVARAIACDLMRRTHKPEPILPPPAVTVHRAVVLGVCVIVMHEGKVLASVRRSGSADQIGRMACPGGTIETTDESFVHAAARELFEETELTLVNASQVGSIKLEDPRPDGARYATVFVIGECEDPRRLQNCEPTKHEDWQWVDPLTAQLWNQDHVIAAACAWSMHVRLKAELERVSRGEVQPRIISTGPEVHVVHTRPPATIIGIAVLVVHDGRVLVSQRLKGASDAVGRWSCPGGGLEGNETIIEGAARELLEETGLEMHAPVLWPEVKEGTRPNGQRYVTHFVVCRCKDPSKLVNREPHKHSEWIWINPTTFMLPARKEDDTLWDRDTMRRVLSGVRPVYDLTAAQPTARVTLLPGDRFMYDALGLDHSLDPEPYDIGLGDLAKLLSALLATHAHDPSDPTRPIDRHDVAAIAQAAKVIDHLARRETQHAITAWADETFGPTTAPRSAVRVGEEMLEFLATIVQAGAARLVELRQEIGIEHFPCEACVDGYVDVGHDTPAPCGVCHGSKISTKQVLREVDFEVPIDALRLRCVDPDALLNAGIVMNEVADVRICMMRLASLLGANVDDADAHKMGINRRRKWRRDGSGCGYHTRE